MTGKRYGLVEAGGTKFVLGVGSSDRTISATTRIETTTPEETLGAMTAWFRGQGNLDAFGIGSFGPLELDRSAPNWGCVTNTPKPHWSGADIAGTLRRAFDRPVAIDTDVNAAALAEFLWGAGQGHKVVLYFTIGTGIGGGAIVDGLILHGQSHPEMGHLSLPRHSADLDFAGTCPFHGACLEGLASGRAIIQRWGASLSDLPGVHPGHDIVAHYLAHAVVTMQAIFEPGRIVLGGGVMSTPGLIDRVKAKATKLGGGYFRGTADAVVAPPALGNDAGLLGALALALG